MLVVYNRPFDDEKQFRIYLQAKFKSPTSLKSRGFRQQVGLLEGWSIQLIADNLANCLY